MTKKPSGAGEDGIGIALDDCSWDYTAPKPLRRFFLNPMSSFFGDFPWEGRNPFQPKTPDSRNAVGPATDSATDSKD